MNKIYFPLWMRTLVYLIRNPQRQNVSQVERAMDVGWTSLHTILPDLTAKQLIFSDIVKRRRYLSLSPKGRELAAHLEVLMEKIP